MKNFKKGDIVYKIVSTNDGGLTISRDEVTNIGVLNVNVLQINEKTGEEETVKKEKQIIKTSKMKSNEFDFTDDYFKRDEIAENILKYLDNISYI